MVKRGRIIAFFLIVLVLAGTIGTTITGITKDMKLGLDLQGGVEILYTVESRDGDEEEIDTEALEATVASLRERVDVLGVSEPNFTIEEPNRIRVQLAGIENENEARELLSTSARLSFRDVYDKEYLDGSDIVEGSARQDFDPTTNQPIVTVEFEDASAFGEVTSEISQMPPPNNRLAIWMDYEQGDSFAEESQKADPKYISAPSVRYTINQPNVQIDGDFSVEEAKRLADILNAGSLDVNLTEEYTTSVGAQFGLQAMDKTIFAGFLGVGFIFLFMIAYYRFPGLIAVVTLSLYIYLVLLVFELMNGVLTLPGIAALILGVGMAVDANIITYERMKEELKEGKSVVASFKAGNSNSLSTIFDANITTLIAATVLFIFGTSSVKGFATLLMVSIVLSFVTAVFGSRFFLGLWVNSKFLNKRPGWFGVKKSEIKNIADKNEIEPKVFGRQFDFVKQRKKFFVVSGSLVLAGIACLSIFGLNLGIDFTSGSRVEINVGETITAEKIEQDFDEIGIEPENIVLSGDNNDIAVARFDSKLEQETVATVRSYFNDAYGSDPNVSTVSPLVGQELAQNAILAVIYASIGIVIYVAIRFEFYFALTAILALLHDAFFILALFSITQLEFDITIIAAILTIVGYSINDTIVTFDRIRENLKAKKRVRSFAELAKIINRSLMQTLGRSINTVLTVIVAAIMLYIFGAVSITNFAFALVVGLLAGTYSSLFIAAQVWLVWRGKSIKEKPIVYTEKKRNDSPQV
ncbi:protein translocase subunit SecDF [Paraliobacillus quinghaiensis]|uniref:Multifunctional fusion protein n=1 Tax=Paraliobacillus quinghaiensis TaxID=470815 RepID=A0A917TNR7_9BACI|nr:protein translocase subunit SecDF [Paraliobacillus quinghaiensis]GGM30761.1 protein translocase subunit SecDF [Paraliobacillus quinghaiensis]